VATGTGKQHDLVYEKQCTKCWFNECKINTKTAFIKYNPNVFRPNSAIFRMLAYKHKCNVLKLQKNNSIHLFQTTFHYPDLYRRVKA